MGCNSEGCCGGKSETYIAPRKITKSPRPENREKGWGYEIIIHDSDEYCGKILRFNPGGKLSLHYHIKKRETWYVASGNFTLVTINPDTAERVVIEIKVGDVIEIHRGIAHQLIAHEGGDIFEVSTPDDIDDSYRVEKGDSQYASVGKRML